MNQNKQPVELPPNAEIPDLQNFQLPEQRVASPAEYGEQVPADQQQAFQEQVAPSVELPEAALTQSFRERWGERLGQAVEVAKRVGRAAVEGVISMDKADREGTATDAHAPMSERVVDRAAKAESLPADGAEHEDRAGMWAKRIVKGASLALTAAKVYKTYKKFK